MKLSVIISTYNSPEWLEKVLAGYRHQTDTGFEILIADDGSTDDTASLVKAFATASGMSLRHVRHEDDGFRKWRIVNQAITQAAGDYLIFTDGDCIPRTELTAVHRARARPGRFLSGGYCRLPMATSKAIGVDEIARGDAFHLSWLMQNGYAPTFKWLKVLAAPWRVDGLLNAISPAKHTFNGNNSSCWKADAIRVGGFDERIRYGGGDREFGYRLENTGVKPLIIRYSALCLHLDHPRGYKDAEVRAANMAIINETRSTGRVKTDYGLGEGNQDG